MRRPLRPTLTRLLAAMLCWAAFGLLLFSAWQNVLQLGRVYPGISLRFTGGISAQNAQNARQYAIQNAGSTPFWPTFWRQENTTLESSLSTQQAPCLFFDGEGELVYPANFLSGSYPALDEQNGCAISSKLAYQLWGSTNVTGLPLLLNNQPYFVRGVFESDQPLVLATPAAGAAAPSWQNAELSGTPITDPQQAAKLFATESGLGQPDSIIVGSQLAGLARLAANLPLFILLSAVIFLSLHKFTKGRPLAKEISFFTIFFLFALFLPRLLSDLPVSIIPNKWSNFSHWSSFAKQLSAQLRDWFMLVPTLKDADAKFLLLGQLLCLFGLLLLVPALVYTNFRSTAKTAPSTAATVMVEDSRSPSLPVADIDDTPALSAPAVAFIPQNSSL